MTEKEGKQPLKDVTGKELNGEALKDVTGGMLPKPGCDCACVKDDKDAGKQAGGN